MADNFKTFAVVNPHSANGHTGRNWHTIAEAIRDAIGVFDFALTSKPMEAPELTRNAISKGYEMIVAVGGDGNNNEVINGFFDDGKPVNPEAAFATVPGGTGGDLARFLKIRGLPYKQIAETLKGKNSVLTDAGKITMRDHGGKQVIRYFINIASLGIGGEVDKIVNRTTKALGGKMSFLIGSVRASLAYKNKIIRYKIDDEDEIEGKFYMIAVCLGRYFGGGMQVAPNSVHNDGLFDIVLMGDMTFWETLKLSGKIYKGAHLNTPKVKSLRGKRLVTTSDEKVYLDVDGEQPGLLSATFEIIPGSVRMKQLKI